MPVSGSDLGSFRAASDLISSDVAQLERTIADLEEAIRHKDLLIATQESVIEAMEAQAQESSTKVPFCYGTRASMDQERFQLLAQISDLKTRNQKLEAIFEELQEGFESLFDAQKEALAAGLQTLSELPSTPEIKGLYARIQQASRSNNCSQNNGQSFSHLRASPNGRSSARAFQISCSQASDDLQKIRALQGGSASCDSEQRQKEHLHAGSGQNPRRERGN